MKVITTGYTYELEDYEGGKPQSLNFIEKNPPTTSYYDEGYTDLETIQDGTSTEEVLRMLVDRMKYMTKQFPGRENSIVLTKLQESLMWLESRKQ